MKIVRYQLVVCYSGTCFQVQDKEYTIPFKDAYHSLLTFHCPSFVLSSSCLKTSQETYHLFASSSFYSNTVWDTEAVMGFKISSLWSAPEINPINRKALTVPILNPFNVYGRVFFFTWWSFFISFWSWLVLQFLNAALAVEAASLTCQVYVLIYTCELGMPGRLWYGLFVHAVDMNGDTDSCRPSWLSKRILTSQPERLQLRTPLVWQ